jgi:hypothetical protein
MTRLHLLGLIASAFMAGGSGARSVGALRACDGTLEEAGTRLAWRSGIEVETWATFFSFMTHFRKRRCKVLAAVKTY